MYIFIYLCTYIRTTTRSAGAAARSTRASRACRPAASGGGSSTPGDKMYCSFHLAGVGQVMSKYVFFE